MMTIQKGIFSELRSAFKFSRTIWNSKKGSVLVSSYFFLKLLNWAINIGPSLRNPETFFIFIVPSSASTSRTLNPVSRMVAFFALDFLKTVPIRPLPMLGVLGMGRM